MTGGKFPCKPCFRLPWVSPPAATGPQGILGLAPPVSTAYKPGVISVANLRLMTAALLISRAAAGVW